MSQIYLQIESARVPNNPHTHAYGSGIRIFGSISAAIFTSCTMSIASIPTARTMSATPGTHSVKTGSTGTHNTVTQSILEKQHPHVCNFTYILISAQLHG